MKVLLLSVTLLLPSCAIYSVDYTVETLDESGNVVTRHIVSGRALVANSSDEVIFRMDTHAEGRNVEFGKTNTGADAQIEVLGAVTDKVACLANPAACIIP